MYEIGGLPGKNESIAGDSLLLDLCLLVLFHSPGEKDGES
jgi:hypothetical protein